MSYESMTKEELLNIRAEEQTKYDKMKSEGLKLDMSRGKPSSDQLDLAMGMLDILSGKSLLLDEQGIDCRNYGLMDGTAEAKRLMAKIIDSPEDLIIIYGNSSLNVMYDTIARSWSHGVMGSVPWCKLDKVKFLCPVPGYDRHFAITEFFGIEMINIPLYEDGPDMDMVEKYVNSDPAVKGIWCVPKYSNPSGCTYSDETVKRFAALKPAAEDFRIFWDNAYCIHHLYNGEPAELLDILSECEKTGNSDIVYKFASTSKITFPGGGISALSASKANLDFIKKQMTVQIISHDKINQIRHARFFGDFNGVMEHMKKHADIMRPKFNIVIDMFEKELSGLDIATWTNPKGGYFIEFNTLNGCAKKVIAMAKDAGVTMTGAGSTYPYHNDPNDSDIRIAPTYPSIDELAEACKIFIVCVKLASIDKILETK